jgi:hypothetical protein
MLGRKRIYGGARCRGYRVGIFARHLVADWVPDHSWRRHRRRLSGHRHADERIFRQEEPRYDGVAGLRDAGRRPHRRTASGSGLSGFRLAKGPGMAAIAGARRRTGAGRVPYAATYGGKPALSPGTMPSHGSVSFRSARGYSPDATCSAAVGKPKTPSPGRHPLSTISTLSISKRAAVSVFTVASSSVAVGDLLNDLINV